ncbi:MAG: putative ABC transporter permease [Bacilli bacterium]|nr:putative ABC transporter permease [Bacilli bacterium]
MDKKIRYYINSFLIYSMIGFIIETSLKFFLFKGMNNGIMYGPWIPVYGIGCIFIIMIMRFVFNRITVPRWLKLFLVFLLSAIILTIAELLGGLLIEKVFHKIFWDYRDMKFHIGPYISLEMALLWGVMSIVVIYLIKPIIDKIIEKVPGIITYLVLITFSIDLVFTFFLR